VSAQFKAETGGKATIVFVEDGKEDQLPEVEKKVFDSQLPLKVKKKFLKPPTDFTDDQADKRVTQEIKLYRCSDDDGTLRVTEVKTGPLYQADLNSGVRSQKY
jgi:villin 1/advillin